MNMPSLTKHDPFRSLFAMPRFIDDFEDFGTQRGLKIRETDKALIAEAVVAGVPAEDIEVNIEDGVLTIRAETSEEKESDEAKSSSHYQYYYTAALSGGKWDKADAEIENGVVKVTIPKTEAVRPRTIKVKEKGSKK